MHTMDAESVLKRSEQAAGAAGAHTRTRTHTHPQAHTIRKIGRWNAEGGCIENVAGDGEAMPHGRPPAG